MSEVINSNLQVWRSKVIDGTITQEEMKAAIAAIRKERTGASVKSDESRAKKATGTTTAKTAKAKPNGDDLLNDFMGGL